MKESTMTTELTVTIALNASDHADIVQFEATLQDWLLRQPNVTRMTLGEPSLQNDHAWRPSQKTTLSTGLCNPFAP
jgi:hypothetical protein